MADDLANDPEYVEACRIAAWAERPSAESSRYWDAAARRFNFPAGWPEGVDAAQYVGTTISAAMSPPPRTPAPPSSGPPSPSVRRLREMLK